MTVAYATSNGTATAGQDYTGTRGTLTISAGDGEARTTRGRFRGVGSLDDEYVEKDETFTVTLSDARGATIRDGKGAGTILDDDAVEPPPPPPLPTLAIDDVEVSEDAEGAEFTVTLSAVSAEAVTVGTKSGTYATSDGTATAGEDYGTKSGTLTIGAGQRLRDNFD